MCCVLFLASCGHSPESAGKKIGSGLCACRTDKQAKAFKTTKAFIDELEDGKFRDQREAAAHMKALSSQADREADECERKVHEEEGVILKDFLRDDDRRTIVNAKRMMVEECFQSREAELKKRTKELQELNQKIQSQIGALPR
jgi:predicted oxidoreductase